jgi:hypothetical protein
MKRRILIIAAAVLVVLVIGGGFFYLYLTRCPKPIIGTATQAGQTLAFPNKSGCCK